jgi:ferric-dicitrate binding protein FerR (iron transport regulator)
MMQENYLAKWLNNELTEKELEEFKSSEEYKSYQRIVDATNSIEAPQFNEQEALTAVLNKRTLNDPKVIQLNPFKKFMRVAAAAVILMLGTYFYMNSLDEKITTQFAENKEILLPDNSEVMLNADSQISYSKKNWTAERNIDLKGEAFFKVAKGEKFTVATDAGTVTVLGTQFNVENRNGIFEVTCYEGLVSVTFKGKETKLPAGNSFLTLDGKIVATEVVNTTLPSWMKAESTFKSMPLKYVLEEFERQHDFEVTTENIDLTKSYTGSFSNTDVNLALKSISIPSGIKFKLEGKKVLFHAKKAD